MSLQVLALVVFAGAFAQAATGVGFGVVAGPFLLLAWGYDRAIVETAAFCLLVALITAALQFRHQEKTATLGLSLTLPVGVALGGAALWTLPREAVVGLFGAMLCALGAALLRQSLRRAATETETFAPFRFGRGMIATGVLAGAGALLFAAPGPAAAWGLARAHLRPGAIRATLAVYFIPAYVVILVVFAATGRAGDADWSGIAVAAPVCVAGTLAGVALGDRLPARALRAGVAAIVILSGLSILIPLL